MQVIKIFSLFSFFIFTNSITLGQVALIKDINTGPTNVPPGFFTEYQNKVYFTAFEDGVGGRLWVTDGTEAGTTVVFDGPPRSYMVSNNSLYMYTSDNNAATIDRELYKSDGTNAGTQLVKNIHPTFNSNIEHMIDLNGILIFSADNGTNGKELWKSDGTETGTVMLRDINPGSGGSSPGQFVELNDKLYFFAIDDFIQVGLWTTDGTTAGTFKIRDIDLGSTNYTNSPNGTLLVKSNDLLFYSDNQSGTNDRELWRSDGTETGTFVLKNINLALSSRPSTLVDVDGTLYFQAILDGNSDYSLWKSDGTEAGTVEIINIWPDSTPFWNGNRSLTNFNGTLYFVGSDFNTGAELWKSDGTANGTTLVKDIDLTSIPGQAFATNGPSQLTVLNDLLYFSAFDGLNAFLYQSDGTSAGTVLVDIVDSSNHVLNPTNMASANDEIYFASDNNAIGGGPGDGLWSTNSTNLNISSNGTGQKMVIYPNPTQNTLQIDGIDANLITEILVMNALGQKIECDYTDSILSLSHISNGLYTLIVKTEKGLSTVKFMKK